MLTTHAGSLPRPAGLIELNRAKSAGEPVDEAELATCLSAAVLDVVRQQRDAGLDIPDDGEFGKATTQAYDYGAWQSYIFERLGGFSPASEAPGARLRPPGGFGVALARFRHRRDWKTFGDFYLDPAAGAFGSGKVAATRGAGLGGARRPVCTGPITYTGHRVLGADIANLKAALEAAGVERGFMCSIAPGSCARTEDAYYRGDEEYVFAVAEALREEYKAIVDAGFILQLDDPALPDSWDMANPEPPLAAYRKFARLRIDATNHALRGLPSGRIRYHVCWGSWHGPHTTDIPLRDIVDLVLEVNAGEYSIEAGNVRHQHEWKIWREVRLPEGKVLVPGVVSHATNVLEDPEVVAERLVRYAQVVGRDRVIAGTDCGLGGRVHPQIAWAKLRALVEGAALASRRLWPARARPATIASGGA
ncbi:MAG: cobalamin-independent methionine synthase II family protein [Burkholderiales bacterium]|nr:cobalamin-independent methionine synthase II family protein [Burkholderiales bacterium]